MSSKYSEQIVTYSYKAQSCFSFWLFKTKALLLDKFDRCTAENRLEPIPCGEQAHEKERDGIQYAEECHELFVLLEDIVML